MEVHNKHLSNLYFNIQLHKTYNVQLCNINQQSSDDACDDMQVSVGVAIRQVWKVWKGNPLTLGVFCT